MQTIRDSIAADRRLRISEQFSSLQGEALSAGYPTLFIRLTGCPLRCQYCDTEYAFHGGQWFSIDDLLSAATASGNRHVCVTGGEPLAQANCIKLLQELCDAGFHVSLETSGAMSITEVDTRVSRVLDLKTPGSGELDKNDWGNLDVLTAHDQIKFVLCDRADYDWALSILEDKQLASLCPVFFSPSYHQLAVNELAQWMIDDKPEARLQMQLHKTLWGEKQGV